MNKPKHAGVGIALGAVLGAAAGVWAGHIAMWLGIGIVIGMVLGATVRRKGSECPECAVVHRAHETKTVRQQARS
jgi:uncharacterized membrane protein YoaK (UPF0700 family)